MSGLTRPHTLVAAIMVMAGPAIACTAEETPMPAQTPPAIGSVAAVEEVYGLWSVRDGETKCLVALSALKSGPGHQVTVEQCTIPMLAKATVWRPVVGGFELMGPADQVLARFRMTGLDTFESPDGRAKGERAIQF